MCRLRVGETIMIEDVTSRLGRPKVTWEVVSQNELQSLGIHVESTKKRSEWK